MALTLAAVVDAARLAGLLEGRDPQLVIDAARSRRLDPVRGVSRVTRLSMRSLWRAVAEARGLPHLTATDLVQSNGSIEGFALSVLRARNVLPVRIGAETFLVTSDPDDPAIDDVAARAGRGRLRAAVADPEDLSAALDAIVRPGADTTGAQRTGGADAVAFVDDVLHEALAARATDVHFEPHDEGARVRLRIDGVLHVHRARVPQDLASAAVSRIKVLAGMDIAESRAAQDGGFSRAVDGPGSPVVDVRVATAPTRSGERATLRLLPPDAESLTLDALGFSETVASRFREAVARPHGLVLVTGATGSGKTTTLYAALREISDPAINVLTVEDPIESAIAGVSQIQVDSAGKVGFAGALRSLLRHDPDVLLVGEIRDDETAEMALRAAVTGHLVLSTVHARSACGAVTRLRDMKCPPYLLAATLEAVMAQVLVRRLCASCRRPADVAGRRRFVATGCARCGGTGYWGRTAVCEFLHVGAAVRRAIAAGADEDDIARAAGDGLVPMHVDAEAKLVAGITTVAELRAVGVVDAQS